jgi:ABC-type bacteriocin/lantibiotic exporter with double-glycine peptidase domain
MLKAIKASLAFMSSKERSKWYLLTAIRAMLSIFDLAGILAIGFVVTSTAIFLTQGSSPGRVLEFAGLQLPAVTAQTLPLVAAAILTIFLVKALLSILITRKAAFFVATIEAKSAKAIAERVFGGDLAQARLRSREEMAYAIQFGSPAAFNYLLNFTSTVIAEGSLFVLVCLGFLAVDPWATLAAVAYFALIALVIQYFVGTLMAKAGAKAAESTIDANAAVGDLIAVFRELSVLGLRKMYIDRIYRSRVSAADSAATQTYLNGMPRYIVEAALLVGVAAFILAQALTGDIVSSAATIGVFLSGGFRLTAAMLPLQAALLSIKGYVPVASKAHEILLDTSNELESPKLTTKEELALIVGRSMPLRVEFKKVSFGYSGESGFAVSNLSLVIEPGQQVAFIGPSGAGKSTIADLMCGVLYPSSGEISVKNQELHLGAQVRECVSYVPQKPGLVSGSVAQNVALGLEPQDIDEVQVLKALANAHLSEVVLALPEGINTDLGKYQDGLSGGQIQRLGLARALYSEPGLLVMDEATSALDANSEAEIAKALDQIRGKVTVVLIAHRLNTVQHADKVFLIEDGKLNDQGTFQELMRRNASIDRLVQLMKIDEN